MIPVNLSKVKLTELNERPSKVHTKTFGLPWHRGGTLAQFVAKLPQILAANNLRSIVNAIVCAKRANRPIILAIGAHVIKVGLNPIIVDAMERGLFTCLAFNGASMIHDVELAIVGYTSENVLNNLADGNFGMARQTGEFINNAIASKPTLGLGQAVGLALLKKNIPYQKNSLLATAARLKLPITVHVAIGTDIIHMHPSFNGAITGQASHYDFRLLIKQITKLNGGVFLNVGSTVILPEIFLKALNTARNLSKKKEPKNFTTINLDMISHYRPITNVVNRVAIVDSQGINLIGHHEINLPLLIAMVYEELG